MDDSTIQTLNDLNRTFYRVFASEFDNTRQSPWPGWKRILGSFDRLRLDTAIPNVLDVGCGNGRFFKYLEANLSGELEYLGVDNCTSLLELAPHSSRSKFEYRDVLLTGLPPGKFSVISAFGFFHHVPGFERRRSLLCSMSESLKPGGCLVLAFWSFAKKPRFEAKTLDWPQELEREEGDYILSWDRGGSGQRYCHHVSEEEEERLLGGLGLELIDRFVADGKSDDLNRYSVLQNN